MVDNEIHVDIKFCTQHDSWNNNPKCGTPYVEQPVYKTVTAFVRTERALYSASLHNGQNSGAFSEDNLKQQSLINYTLRSMFFWDFTQRRAEHTFRGYLSVPSSRAKLSEKIFLDCLTLIYTAAEIWIRAKCS